MQGDAGDAGDRVLVLIWRTRASRDYIENRVTYVTYVTHCDYRRELTLTTLDRTFARLIMQCRPSDCEVYHAGNEQRP